VLGELWAMDLASGRRERRLPDFLMSRYDISSDGRVVFSSPDRDGKPRLWLASLEGRVPPRQLTTIESIGGYFGSNGEVVFQAREGPFQYVYRMKDDGTETRKAISEPVVFLFGVSPDGRWAMVWASGPADAVLAYALDSREARVICNQCGTAGGPARGQAAPIAGWSSDGKSFYFQNKHEHLSNTYVVPLMPGQALPGLPAAGIRTEADLTAWKGRKVISRADVFLGPDPDKYLYVQIATQRNLYRIQIPAD
jgi:hypothetical protein